MMKSIDGLMKRFQARSAEIGNRLDEFKWVMNESENRVFQELAFCLCVPQSKATLCWNAILALAENNLLFSGDREEIRPFLNAVRFGENKSGYIIQARNFFSDNGKIKIKEKILSMPDPVGLRGWLVENVKGFGMKLASHFIRNIGLSDNKVAILDRHILKNLAEYGVIPEIPRSLTKKAYLEVEREMKDFAQELGITLDELDLLFWSEETGMIFK